MRARVLHESDERVDDVSPSVSRANEQKDVVTNETALVLLTRKK